MELDKDVYMIIPFRGGSDIRINNLYKMLDYINSILTIKIYIAEHDTTQKLDFSQYDNIKHFLIRCDDGDLFNRTGTINFLINQCPDNTIIINNDADCIVSEKAYHRAIILVDNNEYEYIIPHSGVGFNVKNDFVFDRMLHIDEVPERWVCAVGGINVFNKDFYVSIGLENENIISWGYEDFERYYRITKLTDKMISPIAGTGFRYKYFNQNTLFKHFDLFHYDHNADRNENSSKNPHKEHNRGIAFSVGDMSVLQLKQYIKSFKYGINRFEVISDIKEDVVIEKLDINYDESDTFTGLCGSYFRLCDSDFDELYDMKFDDLVKINPSIKSNDMKFDSTINYLNIIDGVYKEKKVITFVIPLCNRNENLLVSLKSLLSCNNISLYCNIILLIDDQNASIKDIIDAEKIIKGYDCVTIRQLTVGNPGKYYVNNFSIGHFSNYSLQYVDTKYVSFL